MINNPSRSPTNRISWVSNSIPFVSQKAPVPSATSISDPLPHTLEKISGLLLRLCVPKNNMQGVDWKHNQDNHRNHYWLVHPLVGTPGGFRQKKISKSTQRSTPIYLLCASYVPRPMRHPSQIIEYSRKAIQYIRSHTCMGPSKS